MQYNPTWKSLNFFHTIEPAANDNYIPLHNFYMALNPQVPGVQQNWQYRFTEVNIGTDDGTDPMGDSVNGSVQLDVQSLRCDHKASMGRIAMYGAYITIGNGTDPVTAENVSIYGGNVNIGDGSSIKDLEILSYGIGGSDGLLTGNFRGFNIGGNFGNVDGDVNGYQIGINFKDVDGFSNGYAAFNHFDNVRGVNAFADFQQVLVAVSDNGSYMSFAGQPNLARARYFTGLNINPTIGDLRESADGINVNMDNVTTYAGVKAAVTIQDLTFEFIQAGSFNNSIQIEYVDDVTAGSETAGLSGSLITVHMESGVSTANQIKAAIQANFIINSNITVTGGGSNPQTAVGPTNFAGGVNPGQKRAAYFKGNVQIDGSLSFTGGLSIGALSGFAPLNLVNGGGTPTSAHTLISAPTCPANSTIANADTLGVTTPALITIGANSVITTSFLGVAALGLPAVASIGANASVDRIAGAVFALSLDGGAGAGSVIDTVALCRALSLPNGITQVNRLYGYEMALPFGDVGTDIWGLYISPTSAKNWLAGSLKVGGSDTPATTDSSLEVEKLAVLGRGDTTTRDSFTAVNGSLWYNTDTDKFQGYAAGVWQDLN